MAEIRVGDEVVLRLKVHSTPSEADKWITATPDGQIFYSVNPSAVSEHIPAPRPLEVGDRVRSRGGVKGVIIAIHEPLGDMGRMAWVKWFPKHEPRSVLQTEATASLERDDAAG